MGGDSKAPEQPDLIQLIQVHALRHEPVRLTIESNQGQVGWLCVHRGDVTHAHTAGGKDGFYAFVEIITWTGPQITLIERHEPDERNIDMPMPKLLLEAFWEAENHESDDPPMEVLPTGLEEETVSGDSEFGPPDGVTKAVIETAQLMSRIKGFVGISLLRAESAELVDTLGDRTKMTCPTWVRCIVRDAEQSAQLDNAIFTSTEFIDILIRPISDSDVMFFLRMDRASTNRGLLEVGLRQAREATGV